MAVALAASGMRVAVLGRDEAAVAAVADKIGGQAIVADVLDRTRVIDGINELVAVHGPVDILVNNAGVAGTVGLAWEVDADAWWHTLEVNIRGTHNVTSAVVPGMIQAGSGRIINIVSHAGTARWPYVSDYVVSKAGVIKYGENLAAEVRRHGIAVFNFHPGILEIGFTATLFDSDPQPGTVEGMLADWFRKEIAAGHSADAEQSAALVVRLAAGDADLLTGRYLTAYDDLDELIGRADQIVESKGYTLGLLQP